MIDRETLLDDLKKLTADLVEDLRKRTDEVDSIAASVRAQYADAKGAGRTDRTYEEWREDLLAQVAVAWVLASVFVRFCEDNDLVSTPLLSGPGDRRRLAGDHRADWLAQHPTSGDRDWLLEIFNRFRALPGMAELLGDHNPVWQFGPSDDGAKAIRTLLQKVDPASGELRHDFIDPELDTRFLGDLYQDLSEHAKKTFALLQTPEFVEEFILDRTLDPAIETFGLAETKLIDPACGSGHFLLGAFDRILSAWRRKEPGTPVRELVQRTLNAVNGVDLNPFAVAIARFRLLVAALKASGIRRLQDAPNFHFRVAVGDSLIHGTRSGELFTGSEGFSALLEHRYPTEDGRLANEILRAGEYQAVVGNPPYITVKEPALRDAYRAIYPTAYMQYSLGVPFTERFWDLAVAGKQSQAAGFVGMITANSFMKRQFGKKLIEQWVPGHDITHVIDTSGAYIPGHGTPTVILLGRQQAPVCDTVRGCLGIRGEPEIPEDPARGEVWTAIVTAVDRPGWESTYLSVEDLDRKRLATHPWSLKGGKAPAAQDQISGAGREVLGDLASAIGSTLYTRADDLFIGTRGSYSRFVKDSSRTRPLVAGSDVRDWSTRETLEALFPYDEQFVPTADPPPLVHFLWPYRTTLWERREPNGTIREIGKRWFEWARLLPDRLHPPTITFARVATHNHFVLDHGGRVFKQTALVIKLPKNSVHNDYLRLLGLLNSSTACFWMKQVFHNKGRPGANQTGANQRWEHRYELDGTKLLQFPIPTTAPTELADAIDQLAQKVRELLPSQILSDHPPSKSLLEGARRETEGLRSRMVSLQEELDWAVYAHYRLIASDDSTGWEDAPPIRIGERAFELALARRESPPEGFEKWLEWHGVSPCKAIPGDWPEWYKEIVERRIEMIESNGGLRLLERPEFKRRWHWEPWEELENEALRTWILDRLEHPDFWADHELQTTARLADRLRKDEGFLTAVELFTGRPDFDLSRVVQDLAVDEAVPYAVAHRFKPSGLRRRREWEEVWDLQRREDAIEARTELPADHPGYLSDTAAKRLMEDEGLDRIPVPPKYRKSDYTSATFYKLRGKLDVPQERFISYPDTVRGSDSSPVLGWAGWNHLERVQALASHYSHRQNEGAEPDELTRLLVGLHELVPWLRQWHNEMDPHYGHRMGDFFGSFVEGQARSLGLTLDDLHDWVP